MAVRSAELIETTVGSTRPETPRRPAWSARRFLLLATGVILACFILYFSLGNFLGLKGGPGSGRTSEGSQAGTSHPPVLYSKGESPPPAISAGAPLSVRELASKATNIVIGQVVRVRSKWDRKNKVIFTYATVSVERTLKGEARRQVVVKKLGGTVDGITMQVPGTAAYLEGERVLLFLASRDIDPESEKVSNFCTVELAQGKFSIYREPASGREVATNGGESIYLTDLAEAGKDERRR